MTMADRDTTPTRHGTHPRDASKYPSTTGPLQAVNQEFHATYTRLLDSTRRKLGRAGQPVMIVNGDDLIFLNGGASETAQSSPEEYHRLKASSHLAFGSYLSFLSLERGPLGEDDRRVIERKILMAEEALEGLGHGEVAAESAETHRSVLEETLYILRTVVEEEYLSASAPHDYARRIAPLLLESASTAARLELDRLHELVSAWRELLSEEEWKSLHVVICSGHQARYREATKQYFQRLLGEEEGVGAEREDRVIYAEAITDEESALELLAEHIIDEKASFAFFDHPTRLQQDLLADATEAYLDEILPARD